MLIYVLSGTFLSAAKTQSSQCQSHELNAHTFIASKRGRWILTLSTFQAHYQGKLIINSSLQLKWLLFHDKEGVDN